MGRLEGKIALVTGVGNARGLGAATARRFAQEGAIVHVSDLDLRGVEAIAQHIRAAGGRAEVHGQDVTSEAGWDEVIASIENSHGRLDVLVNNAGIAVLKMLDQLTGDDWRRQTSVNLDSVFYGTQRAVALMRKVGEGGSIVNISSIAGLIGVPAGAAYNAAKGGVRIFSKVVALECAADGIRCNSIHPGLMDTAMLDVARTDNGEALKLMAAGVPLGRLGSPLDIANMALFLASDEAGYITGAEFVVDGGVTAM